MTCWSVWGGGGGSCGGRGRTPGGEYPVTHTLFHFHIHCSTSTLICFNLHCFLFAFVSPLVAEMGLIGIAKSAQLSVFGGVAGLLFAMTGIILNSVSQRAKEIMQILVMRE